MDLLVDTSLGYGLVPPIVTEFPGITVGGAVMGGAGESSSFKYGCFSEICLEYEVILGNGTMRSVSSTKNKDLFEGIASSYGTLGIITQIKIKLIPCKRFVKLKYQRVNNSSVAVKMLEDETKSKIDFIDGIMFSKTQGVIMSGNFTNSTDGFLVSTFHKARDEWFYLHAQSISTNHDKYEELIPIKDYLFRYDRGAFWTGKFGFDIYHVPFLRSLRILFAWIFKTRRLFKFLHGSNLSYQYLIQDLCMPKQSFVQFTNFVDKKYGVYPLWLCPLKPNKREFLSPNYSDSDLIINIGIYGNLKAKVESRVAQNSLLENKVRALGGRKVLYAHSYYSEDSFWSIYDLKYYEELRQKYNASLTLPTLFHKISVHGNTKSSLTKGWARLLVG